MLYGKITDEKIQYAPKTIDGVDYPDESVYLAAGFLPVHLEGFPPNDGYIYTQSWEEHDGIITKTWVRGEYAPIEPYPTTDDKAEAYDILTGAIS